VFPEHKFLIVQCLRKLRYKTGMTGDGVNDAPALKRADVGIAVAGATDAARAAADMILTEEGLSAIIEGIVIARCIFQRMRNFITYRIAATLQLLCFFFIATLAFRPVNYQPSDWQTRSNFDSSPWPDFFKVLASTVHCLLLWSVPQIALQSASICLNHPGFLLLLFFFFSAPFLVPTPFGFLSQWPSLWFPLIYSTVDAGVDAHDHHLAQ
jgi:hypothetical protein